MECFLQNKVLKVLTTTQGNLCRNFKFLQITLQTLLSSSADVPGALPVPGPQPAPPFLHLPPLDQGQQ